MYYKLQKIIYVFYINPFIYFLLSVIKENISSTFALFNRIVYYLFDIIKIIIFEGWSNNEKLKLNTFILGLHLNSFYYYSLNMYLYFL